MNSNFGVLTRRVLRISTSERATIARGKARVRMKIMRQPDAVKNQKLSSFRYICHNRCMIDLTISRYFFNDSFSTYWLWSFLYEFGPIPGDIMVVSALLLLLASFFVKRLVPYRRIYVLLILTLLIGSGLIAHAGLKEHWGRPRPKQITEFGGDYPFFPVYKPNFAGSGTPDIILRSFPCGHCTMGFYFIALGLAFKRLGRRELSLITYGFAFTLGTLLSLARIAQGGHFFTDTLASLIIMWGTAVILDRMLFKKGGIIDT